MVHILVKQIVKDFDTWLAGYKANAHVRREFGSQGSVVFRNPGQANEVLVFFTWDSMDNVNRFAASPQLMDSLERLDSGIPFLLTEAYEVDG